MSPVCHTKVAFNFWGNKKLFQDSLVSQGELPILRKGRISSGTSAVTPFAIWFHKTNESQIRTGIPRCSGGLKTPDLQNWRLLNLLFSEWLASLLVSVSARSSKGRSEVCHRCWVPPLRLCLPVPERERDRGCAETKNGGGRGEARRALYRQQGVSLDDVPHMGPSSREERQSPDMESATGWSWELTPLCQGKAICGWGGVKE